MLAFPRRPQDLLEDVQLLWTLRRQLWDLRDLVLDFFTDLLPTE